MTMSCKNSSSHDYELDQTSQPRLILMSQTLIMNRLEQHAAFAHESNQLLRIQSAVTSTNYTMILELEHTNPFYPICYRLQDAKSNLVT